MTAPVHVRAIFKTDPADPDGDCLVELTCWPINQVLGSQLGEATQAFMKDFLRKAGYTGLGVDLTAKGPTQ